ncbi:MAG: heme-binding protein [Xanthomonadales bacterium]
MRRTGSLAALGTFLLTAAAPLFAVEEPEYRVVERDEPIEIRAYAPMVVAETRVEGSLERAGSRAFRTLFKYIDGENRARQEIAMTAPVTQQRAPEKIEMTAPVTQQRAGDGWAVRFVLPAGYTLETAPEPNDAAVSIREVPAHRAAVIRYSGTWSEGRYREHLARLREWLDARGLEATGDPVWARYDAPYMPWFLRRNEILLRLPDTDG